MPDFGSETERDCCGETCGSSAFWGVRWRMLDARRVNWHNGRKESQQKLTGKLTEKLTEKLVGKLAGYRLIAETKDG